MNVHNYKHLYNLGQYQYIPPALPPHSLPITQLKYLYNFSQHTHPIHFLHTLTHMKSRETFPLTPPPPPTHTHTHTPFPRKLKSIYYTQFKSLYMHSSLPPPPPQPPVSHTHIHTLYTHAQMITLFVFHNRSNPGCAVSLASGGHRPLTFTYTHSVKLGCPPADRKKKKLTSSYPEKERKRGIP